MVTSENLKPGKEFFLASISKHKELIVGKISYCGIDHMTKDYIFINTKDLYIHMKSSELYRIFLTFVDAEKFLLETEEKKLTSEIVRKREEIESLKVDVIKLSHKLSTLVVTDYDVRAYINGIKSGKDWIICLIEKYGPNQMIIHSKENYEIWKSKYGKGGTKGSFNSYVNRIIKDLGYKLNLQKR